MGLYEMALSIPWQIVPDALEAMLSLVADDDAPLPTEEIARRMHGPRSLALRNGKRREDGGRMTMRDSVAVIPIDGPIYRYADYFTQASGGITTQELARQFQTALDDAAVSGILFVVDSPGGEANGIGELADAIFTARERKPIWAYVEGYGASAAYRLASAASRVLIDPEALVGSIGTVLGVPDPTKRPKYTIEFVSTQSPEKRPDVTTPAGRKTMQTLVDDMTEVFIQQVARNRGITAAQVMAPRGGLLVGQKAIDAGLVDGLGAEERAVAELQTQAGRAVRRWPGIDLRQEDLGMKISDIFSGFMKAAKDQGLEIEPEAPAASAPAAQAQQETPATQAAQPTTTTTTAAATQGNGAADAMAARIAELEQRLAEQRTQQITADAAAFAQTAVRERHAMPAEHDTLVQLYLAAAQDDQAAPWPTPTEAEQGRPASRVALLKAQIASRPPHSLTSEQIRVGTGGVLENGAETKMSDGRRQALLAMTPMGQAALDRKTTKSA
jgi:ClpP class serine protease